MNYRKYAEIINKYGLGDKNRVVNMIKKGSEVLEVGCSSGYVTKILVEDLDCKVDCVEVDGEAAKLAVPYARKMYVGSIEDVQLLNRLNMKYDVVLFLDVLEHLVNPGKALINIKNFIKPNGVVIAMVPNIAHWKMRIGLLFGSFDYKEDGILDKTHLRFFTRKTVRKLFFEAGFLIREEDVSVGKLTPFKALPKILMKLFFPNFFARHFIIIAVSCS